MKQLTNQLYLIAQHSSWLSAYTIVVIQNSAAGGFVNKNRYRKILALGNNYITQNNLTDNQHQLDWHWYEVAREGDFTALLPTIKATALGEKLLVITLGGDGIASEVARAVALDEPALRQKTLFLFAPMGTGNDGVACTQMADFFSLLREGMQLGKAIPSRLITVKGQNMAPRYAFNVASLGLDAFVAHATNILKSKIPGNFYKLMVDVAALTYKLFYKIEPSTITLKESSIGKEITFTNKLLLFCVGYQGGAFYGGGKCVIPDSENVFVLDNLSVLKTVINKDNIACGNHRHLKESHLFHSRHIIYNYQGKILLNTDGEILKLDQHSFPLTIDIEASGAMMLKLVN